MKRQCVVWTVAIILLFQLKLSAQDTTSASWIEPYPLSITFSKTTNLIFPYPVKSMDKGSRDVLVQKANGVENVLQLKAARQGFSETNLTVVTADGSLYSYLLTYTDSPRELNISMQNLLQKPLAVFTPDATNDIIHNNAEKVFTKKTLLKHTKDAEHAIKLSLKGLYVQDDVLYFQLGLSNNSWLDYDIRELRLFIKDSKKGRRTASQEVEINPVYVLGNNKTIRSKSEQTVVVAVSRFTIPEKKIFLLQMQEDNGGRNLQLSVKNKRVIRASLIY